MIFLFFPSGPTGGVSPKSEEHGTQQQQLLNFSRDWKKGGRSGERVIIKLIDYG